MAALSVRRAELSLDDLLDAAFADLDDALVAAFAGPRDPQDVFAGRDVAQHHASGSADACLSLVVDVNLGVRRGEDDETRHGGAFPFLDVLRGIFEPGDPIGNRGGPGRRIYFKCSHYRPVDIGRDVGPNAR